MAEIRFTDMNTQEQTVDSDTLVRQAQAGNAEAFNQLVGRYLGVAYSVAYARVRERETAEDLVQEVFLRAFLNIQGLRAPERFSAWIICITRNLACNWLRNGQNRSRLVPLNAMDSLPEEVPNPAMPSPREQASQKQERALMGNAIQGLPESLREVVLLHYGEGLSKAEIARLLGMHPSSIGRLLERALRSLRGMVDSQLRESFQPLRVTHAATLRTVAAITAVALLPTAGKAAMASATADTLALGSSAAIGSWAGALTNLGIMAKTGGAFMATGKGIATGATVIALVAGGVGYQYFAGGGSGAGPLKDINVADPRFAPMARGIREHEASIKTARGKTHKWRFDSKDKFIRYIESDFIYRPGHLRTSFKDTYRPSDAPSTITIEEGQHEYAQGGVLTFYPSNSGGRATVDEFSFAGSHSTTGQFAGVSTLGSPISPEFYRTELFTDPRTRHVSDEMLDGKQCHRLQVDAQTVWICPEQQYSILRSEIGQNSTSTVEMQYISPAGIWFPRRTWNGLRAVNQLATIHGDDGSVAQTVLNEHREDGCDFSDIELNIPLSDDDFEIKLPPGTYIQSSATHKAYQTDTTTTLREILAGKIKERPMTTSNANIVPPDRAFSTALPTLRTPAPR